MGDGSQRPARAVIDAHLRNRRAGRAKDDIEENYADDVVVLSHLGHFRGLEAVATLAALLDQQLENAEFFYDTVLIDGDYGFLQWTATAQDMRVTDGADSFVVRDGRIVMQTIYYSLSTKPDAPNAPPTSDG